jgi:two-component system, cell cycle response regulator
LILGREEIVAALFRETDRAQRMKMPLALIKLGIVAWNSGGFELADSAFDVGLQETVGRITPLLRCYDAVGHMADSQYLLVLPGCSSFNAMTLAERLRDEVFVASAVVCATELRFQACFAVASSDGRSPFVVLRELDVALVSARLDGAGAIQCVASREDIDPSALLLPVLHDEVLHW